MNGHHFCRPLDRGSPILWTPSRISAWSSWRILLREFVVAIMRSPLSRVSLLQATAQVWNLCTITKISSTTLDSFPGSSSVRKVSAKSAVCSNSELHLYWLSKTTLYPQRLWTSSFCLCLVSYILHFNYAKGNDHLSSRSWRYHKSSAVSSDFLGHGP